MPPALARRAASSPNPLLLETRRALSDRLGVARDALQGGRLEEAIKLADAVRHDAAGQFAEIEAIACDCIVRAHYWLDQYGEALRYSLMAIERWDQSGDEHGYLAARCLHATILSVAGQVAEAIEHGSAALQRAEELGESLPLAKALNAVATVYFRMPGRQGDARPLLDRALELVSPEVNLDLWLAIKANVGTQCFEHAKMMEELGDQAAADALYREGVRIKLEGAQQARAAHRPRLVAHSLYNLAMNLCAMSDADAAAPVIDQLAELAQDASCDFPPFRVPFLRGWLSQLRGDLTAARATFESALPGLDASDAMALLNLYEHLTVVTESLGDPAAALKYHRLMHGIRLNLMSEEADRQAQTLKVLREIELAREHAEIARLRGEFLSHQNRRLIRDTQRMQHQSQTDALTGIANRRALDAALRKALRGDASIHVALIDIDHFKQVNDRYSHQTGDEVLRHMGRILSESCRDADLVARYGGEEFAVLLMNVGAETATQIIERLRQEVERHPWQSVHPQLRVTISAGIASAVRPVTPGKLWGAADQRLYAAKAAGRNRVVSDAGPQGLSCG